MIGSLDGNPAVSGEAVFSFILHFQKQSGPPEVVLGKTVKGSVCSGSPSELRGKRPHTLFPAQPPEDPLFRWKAVKQCRRHRFDHGVEKTP